MGRCGHRLLEVGIRIPLVALPPWMLSGSRSTTFPEILNLIAIGVIGDAESFEDRIAKIDIV